MKFWNFLFGRRSRPSSSASPRGSACVVEPLGTSIVQIPALDFVGRWTKSTSGEWAICWSDSDAANSRGGARESGHGRYVLVNLRTNRITIDGPLERPNAGSVANDGTFSLEDWRFGSALSGTFFVFSASGEELVRRDLAANILSSALSETGRYAVCQTANAPSSDGNRFIAFDVRRKTELFSVAPEAGWAERYVFKDDPVRFGVVVPQVGTFFYDLNGHLLDAERMSAARLASESYTVAIPAAEELMKTPALSEEQVRSALETAERVLLLDPPIDIGWRAAALKVKGIALDHLGEHGAALLAFDEALGINPKIGVKRRADALRKRFA